MASGARVAGSPEWPPDTPQALGRPGRARVAVAALVWLLAGASMSSLNKWIFTVHGFGRPLLLSAMHMLAAALACRWGAQRPMPSRTRRQVLLLSLTFGTSMACGNVGLSAVPLDLAQLATTTTPLITLALSALLLGRRHHPLQFAAMGPLCLGAACSLAGELRTPPAGCGFLLAATCLRGLKSIQQSECLGHWRRRWGGVWPRWPCEGYGYYPIFQMKKLRFMTLEEAETEVQKGPTAQRIPSPKLRL